MNSKTLRTYNIIFYVIVAAAFLFILLSNPFLIHRYDPWSYHLGFIKYFYNGMGGGEEWHRMWANVFKMIGIDNIFTWAKIIHLFQFSLAAIIMFYFSKTALTILIRSPLTHLLHRGDEGGSATSTWKKRNDGGLENPTLDKGDDRALGSPTLEKGDLGGLSDEKKTIHIKFLSLFSVFLWFIGNGTFSVAYQQAWIMWYSVTYHGLTVPLTWYCTALTLKIFYEDLSSKKTIFYVALITAASFTVAKFQPLDLLYYLINMSIIFLINSKRLFRFKNKKILFFYAPVIFFLMFIIVRYFVSYKGHSYKVPLFKLISSGENVGQILQQINGLGHRIVLGLNRFPASFSEIALISLIAAVIFGIIYIFKKEKKVTYNMSLFDYLLASSLLFFMIPIIPFFAGLAAYITRNDVVYRFFFGSPWFLFLPFLTYAFLSDIKKDMPFYKVIITNVLLIFLIIFLSKYFSFIFPSKYRDRNVLYHNVESLINSLDKKKVGVQ